MAHINSFKCTVGGKKKKWVWYTICILNMQGYNTERKFYKTLNGLNLKRSNDVKKGIGEEANCMQ